MRPHVVFGDPHRIVVRRTRKPLVPEQFRQLLFVCCHGSSFRSLRNRFRFWINFGIGIGIGIAIEVFVFSLPPARYMNTFHGEGYLTSPVTPPSPPLVSSATMLYGLSGSGNGVIKPRGNDGTNPKRP